MILRAALMRDLLAYDPVTGSLSWLPRTAELFGDDQAKTNAWNARWAGVPALTYPNQDGYLIGKVLGRFYLAHRVAWAVHHGEWPAYQIDHINHIRADNRLANLRVATVTENSRNRRLSPKNKSGKSGVYWLERDGVWHARIYCGRRPIHLGSFKNFEDAVKAREAAEVSYGFHPNHGVA